MKTPAGGRRAAPSGTSSVPPSLSSAPHAPDLDGILITWGDRLFYPGNRIVQVKPQPKLGASGAHQRANAIRQRIEATVVRRAPQVMVKVTGGGRSIPTIRTTDMDRVGRIHVSAETPRVVVPNDKIEQFRVKPGDLLVTRTGSIGVMAVFDGTYLAIPSAYLIRFRFTETLRTRFAYYRLASPKGQAELGLSVTAVTQPNVNAEAIRAVGFHYWMEASVRSGITAVWIRKGLCSWTPRSEAMWPCWTSTQRQASRLQAPLAWARSKPYE